MASYEHAKIESKWQERWEAEQVDRVDDRPEGDGFYCLEMLPYPSGRIHMGHVRNYSIGDAVARNRRMRGYSVMHPIGWDALGMPAENAAIQQAIQPGVWTRQNIDTMRAQLRRLGFSYDWSREIATYRPEYYRWNQWLFLKFLERGLAYRREGPVNWCPSCVTVLANEQVHEGQCWRCETPVEERRLAQWFFRITEYVEELLAGLDDLDGWPERVRTMQRNWIGRSEGAEVDFRVDGVDRVLRVFTTRVDTIYGATFVVVAPEHPFVRQIMDDGPGPGGDVDADAFRSQVERVAAMPRRQRRGDEDLEKAGVFTGHYAINPYSGEKVPVWVANFVLMDYGTGAIMAVPAHDERDFEFATKYEITIRPVIGPGSDETPAWATGDEDLSAAFTEDGVTLDNCGPYSGLRCGVARARMVDAAVEGGFGAVAVDHKLKDWGVSRQRYWGTPIPIIHCEACGPVPVPMSDLPVVLPENVELTGEHGSPLEHVREFVETTCPTCGGAARRETDTMDTFVDSSWYYLRYLSPRHVDGPFDPGTARAWTPVDLYIGGIEHAVMHLLYFRFFCKAFRDLGLLDTGEPVDRLLTQGMVTKDGAKMSKSRGNVVDPDELIEGYGADTMRLFVLFAAPPVKDLEWDQRGVEGCARFLNRVWTIIEGSIADLSDVGEEAGDATALPAELSRLHRKVHDTVRKVTEDVEVHLKFNTAIAALMELTNECYAATAAVPVAEAGAHTFVYRLAFERLAVLLSPFAPHMAHELWELLGHEERVAAVSWPGFDESVLERDEIVLAVQVDGKVRGRLKVPASQTDQDELAHLAVQEENVRNYLQGRELVRSVVIPGKIINLVTRR